MTTVHSDYIWSATDYIPPGARIRCPFCLTVVIRHHLEQHVAAQHYQPV